MAISEEVHWHEGLFLQPHHLQAFQRHVHDLVVNERRFTWAYPYGLIEVELSADELENMRVRFDRLRVVMRSGVCVDVPGNADLPSLDIRQAFAGAGESFAVSLGVPLWYANRANAIELGSDGDWRVSRIFRVAEADRPDENTGENPQRIPLRRINARLLLEGDDRTDLEVLPLLRITHATGGDVGLPRQDPNFVPATMVLAGSPVLRDLVRDLASQVQASRGELIVQITRGGFSIETMQGRQFEQILRLRTLNRFSGRLPYLAAAPAVSPFEMYLELRELLGGLAALNPSRDTFEVADYDHDNPAICFGELSSAIRGLLRGVVREYFLQVPFVRDEEKKIFIAQLTDQHLTAPNEYFLGVKSKQDPRALARLVEDADKFKTMPASLAARRVRGILLKEERHPPLGLPSQVGLHYFRLVRADSQRMWERIKQEKSIAIRWEEVETSDFEVTLYMTIPETDNTT